MSRPPMFPQATPAGIVKSSDGERVVASSRRPDGSYRKELKIRPGYTPDEDVKRYRTARGAESEARAATRGAVPGLAPVGSGVELALAGMSRAQKKNVKRKEKRKEDEVEEGEKREEKEEDVRESWDSDGEEDKEVLPPPPPAPVIEDSKRVKALRKKLRQAEQLREREGLGLYLPPAERAKVKGIADLEEELARMTLGGDGEAEEEAPAAAAAVVV